MQDLIVRADHWLQQNRPGYYASLAPGASIATLDDYEDQTGAALPEDIRALWSWKNGSTDEALLANHMFISVEDSLSSKLELDGMIGYDFEDPDWWKVEWVPFTQTSVVIISALIQHPIQRDKLLTSGTTMRAVTLSLRH